MTQFLKVKTGEEVLELLKCFQPLGVESVELRQGFHRVLAQSMPAPEPVPHFRRATMDGYAVRARDTFGASEILPALLEVKGKVSMGHAAAGSVGAGEAIVIPTGGMLPQGADAVLMVEYTHVLDDMTIEITKPVAPGENVLGVGEDIQAGETLVPSGRRLRSQDIGVMAALGITTLTVYRRPRVAILSTGDEIVPAGTAPLAPGKIRDINGFTLAGQVSEAGGIIGQEEIVPDNLDDLVKACRRVLTEHDVVLLSGGSSVGERDFTVGILSELPEAELLVHGVAIRPGKPTILARIGSRIFWGLPGQPMSSMMICRAFVQPCLGYLQGESDESSAGMLRNVRTAVLNRQLPSVHGRTDYVPVTLSLEGGVHRANPVFGKSAMISTVARAHGYLIIPEHAEGLDRGTEVTVYMF